MPASTFPWLWPLDLERHQRAAVRFRMATHAWEEDLCEFIEALQGGKKLGALGIVDTSANPLASLGMQLSVPGVYGDTPDVYGPRGSKPLIERAPDSGGSESGYMHRAGWAALMPRVEYFARTLGAVAVVPSVDAAYLDTPSGPLSYRLAFPHALYVESHPDRPTEPLDLWEARMRVKPNAKPGDVDRYEYVWYRWTISDPSAPRFAVLDATGERDITAEVFPTAEGLSGDAYPWRYSNGAPYIPHVFYRLDTGDFWGDSQLRAVQRGSLHVGVSMNWAHYATRAAVSNPTFLVNATPKGSGQSQAPLDEDGQRVLSLTPGAILELEVPVEGAQVLVVPAGPGIDPGTIYRAAHDQQAQMLADMGISGKSSTRDHANPTSAAALSIHDSDKRIQQRVGIKAFKVSDQVLIQRSAALLNTLPGVNLPETGYRIGYKLLPLTPEEQKDQREDLDFKLAKGLVSRVDAYVELNPGTDRETALAALRRARADDAALDMAEDDTKDEEPPAAAEDEPDDDEDPDSADMNGRAE